MAMYIYEDNYYNFIERSLYLLQLNLAIFTMTSHAIFVKMSQRTLLVSRVAQKTRTTLLQICLKKSGALLSCHADVIHEPV